MRAEPRSYTARILGFVLLCLLVWQTVGLSHVHMTDADYQHCEICTAFSGSPVMDPPSQLPLSLIPVVLFFVYLLALGQQCFISTRHFENAHPAQAPPAR